MRYASVIEAETVHVKSSFIFVEGDAVIDTSGRGPDSGSGDQPGGVIDGTPGTGTGAGHGGFGGGTDVLGFTTGKPKNKVFFFH